MQFFGDPLDLQRILADDETLQPGERSERTGSGKLAPLMPVFLSEQDLRMVLSMPDLIDAMEGALVQFSSGGATQPLRTVVEVGMQKAFFGVMPAFIPDLPALGTKVVTVFPSNAAAGLPTTGRSSPRGTGGSSAWGRGRT